MSRRITAETALWDLLAECPRGGGDHEGHRCGMLRHFDTGDRIVCVDTRIPVVPLGWVPTRAQTVLDIRTGQG